MTDEETRERTDRLKQALDDRSTYPPGTQEFERAQDEVDRLVVEFVDYALDGGSERPDVTLASGESPA